MWFLATAAFATQPPFELPGTQPEELTVPFDPPQDCAACHGGYAEAAPNDAWGGSMMANAARDPIYLAALAVANQDVPGSGEFCIRCHAPTGWLAGRANPPDGSALLAEDEEGITCDFCHRLVPGPGGEPPIGNGQFFIANDADKRGTYTTDLAPHGVEITAYTGAAELCGLCHDVTNPVNGLPIERTYSEWLQSDYPAEGTTCVTCHLASRQAKPANDASVPPRTVHVHEMAGGNTWAPRVLGQLYPDLDREASFARATVAAEEMLSSAANVTILDTDVVAGASATFTVRVENETGHKLPTGYAEGRLCWLEVEVTDGAGDVLLHSGRWEDGRRVPDDQLRAYEVILGQDQPNYHFILQDTRFSDTRIPPRGMAPNAETAPLGRDYDRSGTGVLAHWDLAPYTVRLASDVAGPITVEATLWYVTASADYLDFLVSETPSGEELAAILDTHGAPEPVAMASGRASYAVTPPLAASDPSGCGCASTVGAAAWPGVILGLLAARRRRR